MFLFRYENENIDIPDLEDLTGTFKYNTYSTIKYCTMKYSKV